MAKKSKKDLYKDYVEQNEDIQELTEEQLSRDLQESQQSQTAYSSEIIPDDIFKYKMVRLIPNSETDYRGLIDKDGVLANIGGKKPNMLELAFLAETIELIKNILTEDRDFYIYDQEGNPETYTKNGHQFYKIITRKVFDTTFQPIVSALGARYKFLLTGSRAMGNEREAILDKTTTIRKSIDRSRQSIKAGYAGTGEEKN